MSIKRAILHMGLAKAGSTSIQQTLFNNAALLEKNGFRYLTEWGGNHLKRYKYLFSEYPVSPKGTGKLGKPLANKNKMNKDSIKKLLNVLETTDCETLVFSGEYIHELWDSTLENLKEFTNKYFKSRGIETTVFIIVRNPLTWITSSLQQQIFDKSYLNKHGDYFDIRMSQYEGIINLKKHFPDSLGLLKFEDACVDKDGLVGCFLKAIGYPEEALADITMDRKNESRSMEVMELANYIEAVEPRYPYDNYRRGNPNRFHKDTNSLKNIKGVKFDLPYPSKVEFWERFQNIILLLKEATGIDYTDYKIPSSSPDEETYSEETIQGFLDAFPKLNIVLQKHFLKFFEKKYMETAQVRFKQLHFKDSVPWKIYNSRNAFSALIKLHIKNKLHTIKKRTKK